MQTPILTKKWNSCLISIFNWKEIIYSVLNGLFHSTGKDRFSGHRFSGQIVRKNDYIRGKFATFNYRFWGHTRFRGQKGSDRFSAKPVVDCIQFGLGHKLYDIFRGILNYTIFYALHLSGNVPILHIYTVWWNIHESLTNETGQTLLNRGTVVYKARAFVFVFWISTC